MFWHNVFHNGSGISSGIGSGLQIFALYINT